MSKVVRLTTKHPLTGVWAPTDSTARYTIRAMGATFEVSAVDGHDGEELIVSGVQWDGTVLQFVSLCPSTNWKVEHSVRVTPGGGIEHRYTHDDPWIRVADE
jgi:hypothetical protein